MNKIEEHINGLPDYELKSLAKQVGYNKPGNKSKEFLRDYLLRNQTKVHRILNPPENFWIKNKTIFFQIIFFVLGVLVILYFRNVDAPKPIKNDSSTTNITLVQDFKNQKLLSLTYFDRKDQRFDTFKNYQESLSWIDRIPNRMDFYEIGLREKLAKYDPDVIYDIIEYSFWRWMMDMSQSYILIEESERKSIRESTSGLVIDITDPLIIDKPVPTEGNKLIELKKPQILLPENSKFYKQENFYVIETNNSILRFCVPRSGMTNFNHDESSFSRRIYNLFDLDIKKQYFQINTEIYIDYKRLDNDLSDETSNFEFKWYKRLEKRLEQDFGFEKIRNKIVSLEK